MKTIHTAITVLWATVMPAWAASASTEEGSGLLVILFLAFGGLIIVMQLVPGLLLFVGMLKGLFSATREKTTIAASEEGNNPS